MSSERDANAVIVFTLNVGNTHTTLHGWRESGPVKLQWRTGSRPPARVLAQVLSREASPLFVAAGVVPKYKAMLVSLLRKAGCGVLVFREDILPRIEIVPRPAARVGDDRIAGALGALAIEGACPWVVVDAGTALTINAVTPGCDSRPPRFEGGLIVPGPQLSLRALGAHTAQLPSLKAGEHPVILGTANCIGRSTEEAMQLGVLHAQAAAMMVLAQRQLAALGNNARVVLTGGGALSPALQATFLAAFPQPRGVVCPNLVHAGLLAAFQDSAPPDEAGDER